MRARTPCGSASIVYPASAAEDLARALRLLLTPPRSAAGSCRLVSLCALLEASTCPPPRTAPSAGAATVATPAGPKCLADLELGEAVLALDPATGALAFSPVYMWTSRRPGQEAQFLTVRTDAGLNLTGGW